MSERASKQNSEIQPYSFSSLTPEKDDYVDGAITEFELRSLSEAQDLQQSITPEVIRLEREFEKESMFKMSDSVREHRGLKQQEENDFQEMVRKEVDRLLALEKENSYKEGFDKGMADGLAKIMDDSKDMFKGQIESFSEFVETAQSDFSGTLVAQQSKIYETVKNLVKWISLKEVEDEEYLQKLIEKLILQINTKNNLVIRVNKEHFTEMTDVVAQLEDRIGKLSNVRIETDLDLHDRGIILESENGIIDGSLVAQFNTLDKMFEFVGVGGDDEN